MKQIAFLSLGSNLGDRLDYLARAIRYLTDGDTIITRCSSVYETAPQGKTDQPAFLNVVVEVGTTRTAQSLLHRLRRVEQELGRERHERWGPRTVDIDILLYGDEEITDDDLQVPHPRMMERAFVLIPLQEIAPQLHIPGGSRKPVSTLVAAVSNQGVTLHEDSRSFLNRVSGVK